MLRPWLELDSESSTRFGSACTTHLPHSSSGVSYPAIPPPHRREAAAHTGPGSSPHTRDQPQHGRPFPGGQEQHGPSQRGRATAPRSWGEDAQPVWTTREPSTASVPQEVTSQTQGPVSRPRRGSLRAPCWDPSRVAAPGRTQLHSDGPLPHGGGQHAAPGSWLCPARPWLPQPSGEGASRWVICFFFFL